MQGLARTASILAEYYVSGRVIHQATSSSVDFLIYAPTAGSFKQELRAAIAGGIIVAGFETFFGVVIDQWLPAPDPAQEAMLAEEKKQTDLLRSIDSRLAFSSYTFEKRLPGLPTLGMPGVPASPASPSAPSAPELLSVPDKQSVIEELNKHHAKELTVLRSITSNSFVDIFRPVGDTVEYSQIRVGSHKRPSKTITPTTKAIIRSDELDETPRTIRARVTGFTRGTKRGVVFSEALGHGFRFEYRGKETNLPKRDIFSWSQYNQEDIILEGNFVYFFDGKIKKMLVYYAGPVRG